MGYNILIFELDEVLDLKGEIKKRTVIYSPCVVAGAGLEPTTFGL